MKAAVEDDKSLFHIHPTKKSNQFYQALVEKVKKAISEGRRVDFNWLWGKAHVIYREQQNDLDAFVRKHLIVGLIKKKNLKLRRLQGKGKPNKEQNVINLPFQHFLFQSFREFVSLRC